MRPHTSMGLAQLCELFGKSRQAYYDASWRAKDQLLAAEVILSLVEGLRSKMPRVGTNKLLHLLKEPLAGHGIKIGRDKLNELLANHGMLVKRHRKRVSTTNSRHRFRKYPYLLSDYRPMSPNALWVADITYLRMSEGFCYLSLLTDAYSRLIVGYCLCAHLGSEGPLKALEMALELQKPKKGLIHHSDRGTQYCSADYVDVLKLALCRISMAGSAYENPVAERINGILKDEFALGETFKSYGSASMAVEEAVRVYNGERPHGSIDYKTPEEAHKTTGKIKKRW